MIAILLIGTVVLVASYIFLRINGKAIITEKLSAALNRKVTMTDMRLSFPLTLRIKDFQIQDCLSTREARISISPFAILNNNVRFSTFHLVEPVILLQKTKDNRFVFGEIQSEPSAPSDSSATSAAPVGTDIPAIIKKAEQKRGDLKFLVGKLIITNGQIKFVDYSVENEPFHFTVNDINLKASKICYPAEKMDTKFDFSAVVANLAEDLPKGKMESSGWVDFNKKNMSAKVHIENLDGSLFRPFYKDFLTNVRGVTVNLFSDLVSKNNDMIVKGKLAIKSRPMPKDSSGDSGSFSVEDFILKGLQESGAEIVTNFQFKTKMDSFKIESIPFSGSVRQIKSEEKKEEVPAVIIGNQSI